MSEQNQATDTGIHTNPQQWLHNWHWDSGAELVLVNAVAANLGAVVAAGRVRRIKEITVRNMAQSDTIVTISVGGVNRLSIEVPLQTTRVWSSEDGRAFTAGQQVQAASSAAGAGTQTFITASGVEAAQS